MKLKASLIVLLAIGAACISPSVAGSLSLVPATRATATATQTNQDGAPATRPAPLPGRGLAEHPFLYCGEWDTRKPDQTIFLVRGGKVVWTYLIPIKNEKGQLNEFDDIHLLSNGHVLYARKTGAAEVTP